MVLHAVVVRLRPAAIWLVRSSDYQRSWTAHKTNEQYARY